MFAKLSNGLAKVEDWMALIGGIGVAVMMGWTVADVLLRYILARPVRGTLEYITWVMVFVVLFGVSYCQRRWEHLAMGLLYERVPPKFHRPILAVLIGLGIYICFILTWSTLDKTIWAYVTGDTYLGAIVLKTWWARLALPIGLGVVTMRLILQMGQLIRKEIP